MCDVAVTFIIALVIGLPLHFIVWWIIDKKRGY